jgi:hypothetical protein
MFAGGVGAGCDSGEVKAAKVKKDAKAMAAVRAEAIFVGFMVELVELSEQRVMPYRIGRQVPRKTDNMKNHSTVVPSAYRAKLLACRILRRLSCGPDSFATALVASDHCFDHRIPKMSTMRIKPIISVFTLAATLLLSIPAFSEVPTGLNAVVDLGLTYGVDASNGSAEVRTAYDNITAVRAAFPAWTARWEEDGKNIDDLLSLSVFTCAWNDAVARYARLAGATLTIEVPAGQYRVDHTLYVMNGGAHGVMDGGTQLVMDRMQWVGNGDAMLQIWPGTAANGSIKLSELAFSAPAMFAGAPVAGIRLAWPGEQVSVQRVSLTGFSGIAIEVDGSKATDLRDLQLTGNGSGIALLGCTGNEHFAENITGSANGTWFQNGPLGSVSPSNTWKITSVNATTDARSVEGRLFSSIGAVQVEINGVRMTGGNAMAWIEASNADQRSRISGKDIFLSENGRELLYDLDLRASYNTFGRTAKPFNFCWTPGATPGALPEQCGDSPVVAREQSADTAFYGNTLKSSGASIVIGAVSGSPLTNLQWGYNTSGLFSMAAGNDTALQNRIGELGPKTLRFPGGTLANFYHPTGLGYGLRQQDVNQVSGTTVFGNINDSYLGEQADIAAGKVSGNYINEMIQLAQANNSSVLYVANLFTGTVNEMVSGIQAFINAGVQVTGVELGNEAHLKAYQSRFGTVENYLQVAQPYAAAITANFPGMSIGLDAYPPGILKDLGPGGTQKAYDWNVACTNASFGDALIIHCYSRPPACDQTGVTANFNCGADFSQTYANDKLPPALTELASLGNKKIWITEWNIDGNYSHYGNSVAQSMFYADMCFSMANEPKVTVSTYHNLLSYDDGYNVVKRGWEVHDPQINYYTGRLFSDFYVSGNQPQEVTVTGLNGVRAFAFVASNGKQHLYMINRSGAAMDLSAFQGNATNVAFTTLGSSDIAEGSGSNSARPNGNVLPQNGTAAVISDVMLPPYGIAHLSWTPGSGTQPPPNSLVWKSTFSGNDGCLLKATVGSDISQSNSSRCANVSGGKVTTLNNSAFPVSVNVSKVVLMGVTFSNVSPGYWINGRVFFNGASGQIKDSVTGEVLGNVVAGVRYNQLVLDFGQSVPLSSLIGKPNGGNTTAPMTIEAMKLLP